MLFLTYAYPPSRQPRAIQISRIIQHLKDYDITVIAGNDNLMPDEVPPPSNAKVFRVTPSCFTDYIYTCRGDCVKRAFLPDLYYFWSNDLYKLANKHIKNHDIVVTFGMPMSIHNAGFRIKKENPNIKWIAHFSDPWIENPYVKMNIWTKFWNQKAQNKVFKTADQLIFTSQETVDLCLKNYSDIIRKKGSFISHSFDEKLFPKRNRDNDEIFLVRHLGQFYGPRKPDPFLEAVKYLKDNNKFPNNVQIEFIGANTPEGFYDPNIRFFPSIPYSESLQKMVDADLLLLIDANIEKSVFFPSKLVEYLGTMKPIFGISKEGTYRNILDDFNFLTANPDNIEEIADKFLKSINATFSIQHEKIMKYESKNVADLFIKIITR